MLGSGVRLQAEAFREGFSKVFPISDLQSFTPDELAIIFGNATEDWSSESKYSWNTLVELGLIFLVQLSARRSRRIMASIATVGRFGI